MTAAQRARILQRGRALGYTGNNLGQLSAIAEGIANGNTRRSVTANQRRTARSLADSLSGSA